MAVKLYSEFKSDTGKYYKIEIHDEDYSGSSPDVFTVGSDGFTLSYRGNENVIYSSIIGSSVTFSLYINDTATQSFVNNLKVYQQNRYFIKIFRGTESSNTFIWGGYILQDVMDIEDVSTPRKINITAHDGISKLKNFEGNTGYNTLTNIFVNAIYESYSTSIFSASDIALKVISNWWSQQHTYSASEQALQTTVIDQNTFHEFDDEGNVVKASLYEILDSLCKIFGLRFYFSDGVFRLEQIWERSNTNLVEFSYRANGNLSAIETISRDKTIDQTSNAARLAGNIFNFLPAVNTTQITIDRHSVDLNGVTHTTAVAPQIDLGFIPNDSNNQLSISNKRTIFLTVPSLVATTDIYGIINMDIVLTDGTDTYYLKRDITTSATGVGLQYNNMSWSTVQSGSGYKIFIGPFTESFDQSIDTSNTITTPPLPISGNLTIDTNFDKFVDKLNATYTLGGSSSVSYEVQFLNVQTTNNDGFTNATNTIKATTTNADIDGGIIYDIGTTKIYDALGARGSLYEIDATTLVRTPTTGWREGNSGTYTKVQNLVTKEMLRLMNKPIQKYGGQFFSNHDFRDRLVFDSKNWIQLSGDFTANDDQWNGSWFAINKETISSTNSDTGQSNAVFSVGSSSVNGSIIVDSIDIGSADAANISTGTMTNNGAVVTAVNTIAGTPGGTTTIDSSNYMNFLSYSGANGNHTINLPASVNGVFLRFKTNETVVANKTITLDPNGSETIDGETTYVMNRSYDGISLLGVGSQWLVVQKKEK